MSVRARWSPRRRALVHARVAAWKLLTPAVLQRAIRAGWDGTSTPAQSKLLSAWVTSRVMDEPIPESAYASSLDGD